jgi:HEAT repeat protein
MIKKILFVLIAAVALQFNVFAQDKTTDQRTVTTRIADLLAQLPARDAKQFNGNMEEISQLGVEGYTTLISGLTAPGKGNNALIEYAVSGFSGYVSQPGKQDWKKMSEVAYLKALDRLTDKQNKSFIISQLELTGSDAAVGILSQYLADADLADPASRALVKVNSISARRALLSGLSKATGAARLSVIAALGDSRDKAAAQPIAALANSTDANLVKTVLYALSQIADPSSEPILAAAAEKSGFKYENTNAVAAYLYYAEQLMKDGQKEQANKIAKNILQKTTGDDQVPVRTAALKIVSDFSPAQSDEYLLAAMNDKQFNYRAAALKLALPHLTPERADLWVKKIAKTDPPTQVAILNMLGESQSKTAFPAILKLLKHKDQSVRAAAIRAAGQIGQEASLDPLLKIIAKADSTDITAVSNALLRIKGGGVTAKIAAFIPKAKPEVQVALVNILAAKAAHTELPVIYSLLKSKELQVKQAALTALKQTVTSENISQLFILLSETSDQAELLKVQEAIIAALKSSPDSEQQVDAVLKQMAAAPESKKPLFYKILASLGGNKSLKAVSEAFNTGNEDTKKAAIEALSSWTDALAITELIKISRDPAQAVYADKALNGYLNLVRVTKHQPEQRLKLLSEAMSVTKVPSQQKQILKDLEQAKCFDALLFAGDYLDDPTLQQVAANTVMGIALADKSYRGTQVRELVEKTINAIKGADSEYQKEALRLYLSEMPPRVISKPFVLSAQEKKEGYKVLFDGSNMDSWMGNTTDYILEDGNIAIRPRPGKGSGGNLFTKEEFSDFIFRFEFQLTPGANNGLGIRAPLTGDAAYTGIELQILDNEAPIYKDLHVYQYHGSVYGTIPAKRGFLKPVGEWNYQEVIVNGPKIKVILNGTLILDADITEARKNGAADGKKHPGLLRDSGHIGFLGHGSPLQFRNIRVRDLNKKK